MAWYKRAGDNGSREAICNIGTLYQFGLGVPVEYKQTLALYEKAADNGPALNGIGMLYRDGLRIVQSYSIRKGAASKGNDGYNSLGYAFKTGQGVNRNYNGAMEWYTKSAETMNDTGQLNLGIMYLKGLGTEINEKLALYWLKKSVKYGNEKAQDYIDRIEGAGAYTSGMNLERYRKILNWKWKTKQQKQSNKLKIKLLC
jgi:hypothetical protein